MRLEDPLKGALIKLFVFGEGRRSKDYRPRERRGSLTILEQKGSSKTKSKTKKKRKQECVGGPIFVKFVFVMESSRSRLVNITHTPNGRRHTSFDARRIELKDFWNHHVLLLGRIFPRCNCWYCDLPLDSESSAETK